jgi:hypothetical protein
MREDTRGVRAASGWKGASDQDSLFWRALCAEHDQRDDLHTLVTSCRDLLSGRNDLCKL